MRAYHGDVSPVRHSGAQTPDNDLGVDTPLLSQNQRNRRPFEYRPINSRHEGGIQHWRYRFVSKATSYEAQIPDHVLPPSLFVLGTVEEGSQSSLITMYSP